MVEAEQQATERGRLVCEDLCKMMWLYRGYKLGHSREIFGVLRRAMDAFRPDISEALDQGCDYDEIWKRFFAERDEASEPVSLAAGGERAIVVGSTWAFNGNEDRVILSLDPIEVGIPGPVRVPHGTWKDEAVFRKLYTWVTDPAPPQQPVERDEPVDQRDTALATVAKLTAELDAARSGHDPKVCGELIAKLRHGLLSPDDGAAHRRSRRDAWECVSKLAAMLGVKEGT
jgi:hypothetical protein